MRFILLYVCLNSTCPVAVEVELVPGAPVSAYLPLPCPACGSTLGVKK